MSNPKAPMLVSDEEPESPNSASTNEPSEHSATRSPTPAASPEPPQPAAQPNPTVTEPPVSPSHGSVSRFRQHLRAVGASTKRTARKRVRLAPLQVAQIQEFGWVRDTLERWRNEEGLQKVMEVGESSLSPNMPITREPIERTIPPLVIRTDRHDRVIHEWKIRHSQLESQVRDKIEPKLFGVESKVHKTGQDLTILQMKVDMLEGENAHLREDVEEQEDTITAMEEYIDLLEQRIVVIEDGYARTEQVTDALQSVIQALSNLHLPPPPPPQ